MLLGCIAKFPSGVRRSIPWKSLRLNWGQSGWDLLGLKNVGETGWVGCSIEGARQTHVSPQEHVIHVWEETGSPFHNCLIQLYCEKVQGLMKEYLLSFPAGTSSHRKPRGPGP